jgi:integrase/recombinase XerC
LNVRDFDAASKTKADSGKGRGTQSEVVDLGVATVQAIADWLEGRGSFSHDSPLFIALDSAHSGHRLSGDGICKMVVRHSERLVSKNRCRLTASGTALSRRHWTQQTGMSKGQKLSRHRNLNTLMIYDDNRGRDQQDVTEMLDGMF